MFGTMFVLPVMTEYLDLYPEVTARGLFVDRVVNIVDEGIDVAVRIGHLSESGFTATHVGQIKRVICGSPAYFEKYGVPAAPNDPARHQIVASTSAWTSLEWRFAGERKATVRVNPRLFCNTNEAAVAAAVRSWGLTRVLSYQIAPQLESGELQTVLSHYGEEALPIPSRWTECLNKGQKLFDFAVGKLRANPHFS
jgi:DNA-binding transcriptional LysR family regulator